jgi:GNAT superfamily N-acetyltransferase
MLNCRQIRLNEVEQFREVRLVSLRRHPDQLLGSLDHESSQSLVFHMTQLRDNIVVGLYAGDALCGITYATRHGGGSQRLAHKINSWGTFVDREKLATLVDIKTCGRPGTAMLSTMLDLLKERGIKNCHAGINSDNDRSLALYERLGFQRTYTEKYGVLRHGGNGYEDIVHVLKYLD